ncbi:hypothetical protein GGX14DRAFT_579328 [Mycena pura]|uniref:Uncharacterized protein n=1 Tax=Mycena pura TaxID=153505 RepID=A0AAD6XX18_9AGAR|nr:hypothetical protein GGX14DRAFT_579328 [Mycena pura]
MRACPPRPTPAPLACAHQDPRRHPTWSAPHKLHERVQGAPAHAPHNTMTAPALVRRRPPVPVLASSVCSFRKSLRTPGERPAVRHSPPQARSACVCIPAPKRTHQRRHVPAPGPTHHRRTLVTAPAPTQPSRRTHKSHEHPRAGTMHTAVLVRPTPAHTRAPDSVPTRAVDRSGTGAHASNPHAYPYGGHARGKQRAHRPTCTADSALTRAAHACDGARARWCRHKHAHHAARACMHGPAHGGQRSHVRGGQSAHADSAPCPCARMPVTARGQHAHARGDGARTGAYARARRTGHARAAARAGTGCVHTSAAQGVRGGQRGDSTHERGAGHAHVRRIGRGQGAYARARHRARVADSAGTVRTSAAQGTRVRGGQRAHARARRTARARACAADSARTHAGTGRGQARTHGRGGQGTRGGQRGDSTHEHGTGHARTRRTVLGQRADGCARTRRTVRGQRADGCACTRRTRAPATCHVAQATHICRFISSSR